MRRWPAHRSSCASTRNRCSPPDGYGDTASDVAAALRTAARERYILEANLEDLAIDDEPELFSERVSAYESVATIRACAETMRRLHHERTAEASPEKARRLCQAILEVHNHAEVTWRWIELEENVNDADEMAQATLAWTECLRLRTDEVAFWSDGLDATVMSTTMRGVSKKEREQLTSRRVDPTGFVAGLARTKGARSFIPLPPQAGRDPLRDIQPREKTVRASG